MLLRQIKLAPRHGTRRDRQWVPPPPLLPQSPPPLSALSLEPPQLPKSAGLPELSDEPEEEPLPENQPVRLQLSELTDGPASPLSRPGVRRANLRSVRTRSARARSA